MKKTDEGKGAAYNRISPWDLVKLRKESQTTIHSLKQLKLRPHKIYKNVEMQVQTRNLSQSLMGCYGFNP